MLVHARHSHERRWQVKVDSGHDSRPPADWTGRVLLLCTGPTLHLSFACIWPQYIEPLRLHGRGQSVPMTPGMRVMAGELDGQDESSGSMPGPADRPQMNMVWCPADDSLVIVAMMPSSCPWLGYSMSQIKTTGTQTFLRRAGPLTCRIVNNIWGFFFFFFSALPISLRTLSNTMQINQYRQDSKVGVWNPHFPHVNAAKQLQNPQNPDSLFPSKGKICQIARGSSVKPETAERIDPLHGGEEPTCRRYAKRVLGPFDRAWGPPPDALVADLGNRDSYILHNPIAGDPAAFPASLNTHPLGAVT